MVCKADLLLFQCSIATRTDRLWANSRLREIIRDVTNAGLIDEVANGFRATVGHAGTHSAAYVDDLIEVMTGGTSPMQMIEGIDILREFIKAGRYL